MFILFIMFIMLTILFFFIMYIMFLIFIMFIVFIMIILFQLLSLVRQSTTLLNFCSCLFRQIQGTAWKGGTKTKALPYRKRPWEKCCRIVSIMKKYNHAMLWILNNPQISFCCSAGPSAVPKNALGFSFTRVRKVENSVSRYYQMIPCSCIVTSD